MRCFQGVAVGFPTGPGAHNPAEQSWIHWCQGDLRIDAASLGIVFSPMGCNGLASKPLGCLTGTSVIPPEHPGGLSTFVATTNDPVHGLLRLNLQSLADEDAFVEMAEAANTSSSGRFPGGAGHRSSLASRCSSVCPGASGDNLSEATRCRINEQFPGAWPLIHGVAELYGADPRGEPGSEVLLGRGAVVILDSQDATRVGTYELLFFDEGYADPLFRVLISPRLRITQLCPVSAMGGKLSASQQRIQRRSFEVSAPGGGPWGLVFDLEDDAAAFSRDYLVRQRLVSLSLKTSRGWRTVDELKDEIAEMRRRGLGAMLWQWLQQAAFFIAISLFVYACVLFADDPQQPLLGVVSTAIGDAISASFSITGFMADTIGAICGSFSRAVPVAELRRCVALPEALDVRSCAARLSGGSVWL